MKKIGSLLLGVIVMSGMFLTSCQDISSDNEEMGSSLSSAIEKSKQIGHGNKHNGLNPNSRRYADNSMPSASGRDGKVIVTSRALIDSEGNVDLEVTTGELDSDENAPGTITKLQVKALTLGNPDKKNSIWTKNFNKLRNGGYFSTSYTGLERGQEIYVHANVKGIIRGTAVTFMNETIKARPDITVTTIDSELEVFTNTPVTIIAGLAELNGDLGAATSCVLYIDGIESDRINNAWVNAGDVVGCQFTTSFSEAGDKNIVIAAEDVIPGDFDSSNNSSFTTITVTEPSTGFGPNSFSWSANINGSYDQSESRNFMGMNFNSEITDYRINVQGTKSMPEPINGQINVSTIITTSGTTIVEEDYILNEVPFPFPGVRYLIYEVLAPGGRRSVQLGVFLTGNSLQFTYYLNTYKIIYISGDVYQETLAGPEFSFGDELSFDFLVNDHALSGSFGVFSSTSGGSNSSGSFTRTTYSGSGSGQPEVNAESNDEEGENDEEEEY
ncbi:MAG: hypothetical protein RLN90_01770 [Balneolaceae bacterium]